LKDLFQDYDPLERPSLNDSQNLKVELGMAIQQIVDVDEKQQTIILSGWLDMVNIFIILNLFSNYLHL
jgi:flagellar biosynthesis protein FliR